MEPDDKKYYDAAKAYHSTGSLEQFLKEMKSRGWNNNDYSKLEELWHVLDAFYDLYGEYNG